MPLIFAVLPKDDVFGRVYSHCVLNTKFIHFEIVLGGLRRISRCILVQNQLLVLRNYDSFSQTNTQSVFKQDSERSLY